MSDMSEPLIGAHMSIAGGLYKAFARGKETGCRAMQIFTKNASRWLAKPLDAAAASAFRQAWSSSGIGPVIAHDSYLINLAAPGDELWLKSIAAFLDEMERCSLLGIPYLVMHPGSHVGSGEQVGLRRVCDAFRHIFTDGPADVTVLIENTAGQGNSLGAGFEHLEAIMDGVPRGRFGICFDTCHAYAAGYDLGSAEGYESTFAEFDRLIGVEAIRAFHVNDCKKPLGSRVDRHEHIGQGTLGEGGFRRLMHDPRFTAVPKLLETPKGEGMEMDLRNLAMLRRLAGQG